MAEQRKVEKKIENEIVSVVCPCCGELIPVRIGIAGYGIDENYVSIGGTVVEADKPFPDVSVELKVDLMGLKFEGGLDEIMENRSDAQKEMDQRRYDYNKAQGVYFASEEERADFENVGRLELEANRSD